MFARSSKRKDNVLSHRCRELRPLLLFAVSLTLATPWAVQAGSLVDLNASFNQDAETLHSQYESAIRQVRAPGTPGTATGSVGSADVQLFERSLESARQQALKLLALPSTPPADGSAFLTPDLKQSVANRYISLLTDAVVLRATLGYPHDASWRDGFALKIPKSLIGDVAEMGSIQPGRRGEPYTAVIIDRGSDGSADPVLIRLSDSYVEGIELGALSDKTRSEEALLTLVKYLTIRQLQDNLELTQSLQGRTPTINTEMPAELAQALPSLGLSESVYRERRSLVRTAAFGAALTKVLVKNAASMPTFANSSTVDQMVSLIAAAASTSAVPASTFKADLTAPFTGVLKDAQSAKWEDSLNHEIPAYDAAAIERAGEDGVRQLRKAISGAIAATQMQKVAELMTTGEIQLDQDRAVKLLEVIARRQAEIEASLPATLITDTIAGAKKETTRQLTQAPREKLIEEITLGARDAREKIQGLKDGTILDFAALFTALQSKVTEITTDPKRPSRPRLERWLKDLQSAPTWTEARLRYTATFANELHPDALADGQVEKARALAIIASDQVVPSVELPPVISPEYRQRLVSAVAADLRADWQAFIKVGDVFGLNWSWRDYSTEPGPKKFLADSSAYSLYQSTVQKRVRDQYPVVSEIVSVDGQNRMLADIVDELTADGTETDEGFDRISSLLDQALARVEARIRKDVATTAQAKSFKEIEPLLQSELTIGSLVQLFPEFKDRYIRTLEKMARPSTAEILLHEDGGTYMAAGFGALMLLWVGQRFIPPAAPLCAATIEGLSPLLNGYIRSATAIAAATTLTQGRQLWNTYRSTSMIGDFYAATPAAAWTGSFFGLSTVEAARSSFHIQLAFYLGQLAMDGYFLYWPMFREFMPFFRGSPGTAIGAWGPATFDDLYAFGQQKSDLLTDVDAFHVMGVKPGAWNEINAETLSGRLSWARAKGGTQYAQLKRVIELAYSRLRTKIAAGRTWEVIDGTTGYEMAPSRSASESALIRVLRKSRWGGSIR